MFGFIKASRQARKARQVYELVRIEALMAENSRRLAELAEPDECLICKKLDRLAATR